MHESTVPRDICPDNPYVAVSLWTTTRKYAQSPNLERFGFV